MQSPDRLDTPSAKVPGLTSSSLLARNAVLNLATEGWIFLVLVAAMPKLVALLGETSFGLFSLAWVVIGYLSFLDVGVNRAATKFVSEHLATPDHESANLIVRTALAANLALGLLGGMAVAVASPYLVHSLFKISAQQQGEARLTFYMVALSVPVLLVQGILRSVLSSFQRFGWINAVNAAVTAVQWGGAVALAWLGHGVAMVVLVAVAARLAATLAYGIVLFRLLPGFRVFEPRGFRGLSKLLRFGSWVSVSQVVSPLLVYLDRMLIASFVSLGAVTLYTVPYEVMTRLRIIPSSLVATLYPAFSERGTEAQLTNLQRLYEGSVRYLLLLLLPGILFLVVLGPDLLTVWMGSAFARQTSEVLQILAVGVLANGLAYVPYNMLQALGRPDLTGKFHLLELPPYIVLCICLIPRWGIAGAAFASTIRFLADSALLFWAVHRYCRCSLRAFWTAAFLPLAGLSGILGLVLILVRIASRGPWIHLALGGLALAGYLAAVWVLLVDSQEKPRISQAVRIFPSQPTV